MARRVISRVLWSLGIVALFAAGASLVWFSSLNGGDRLWYLSGPPSEEHLTERLGGQRVVAILKRPDLVEAVLLGEPTDFLGRYPEPHEYIVVSEAKEVPADVASDVATSLTSPRLHRMIDPGAKSCITRYGARMTYFSGSDKAELYFCFTCMDLDLYLNERPVGLMQIIFVCKRLLRDMQAIFPENAELLELEKRCHGRSN